MAVVNRVQLSDAVAHNRFSAEFFDPRYVLTPAPGMEWVPIGRVLKKCEYGLSISMNSESRGFPMFRMNEIDGCFALRPEKYANISRSLFDAYALKENDVLFNRTNSFEFVGRTGLVKDQTDCTFASYLIRLVPDTGRLLPEFLTIYLNTRFGIGQIKRRAMRSINQANVSGSEVRRILIPLPEQQVQQEIANLVNTAFSKQRESLAKYNEAQQLLESELGLNKLTFQKPVGYIARLSEATASGRIDADHFQPQYATVRSLVKSYSRGYEPLLACCDSQKPNIDPSKTPKQVFSYIELSNIDSSIGAVEGAVTGCGNELPSRAKRQVKTGDVIASAVVGSIDKVAIITNVQDGFIASSGFFHLRPRTVSAEYLLMLVRSKCVQMQFQQQATGGILSAVPDSRLKHVLVPKLADAVKEQITELVMQSHEAKRQSGNLLEQAKTRVEQLIEEAVQP